MIISGSASPAGQLWKQTAWDCCAHAVWTAVLAGKTAMLEHPAEDVQDVEQPSIWKIPIMFLLLRFQSCRRVRVLQGY